MAYDEFQADRLRASLRRSGVQFTQKKMMGGLCILMDDKMLVGLLQSKTIGTDLLMIRIGEDKYEQIKDMPSVLPMDFTGRPMKGYAFIAADGFDMDDDLDRWVSYCIDYNPFANSSKKKSKK